jgi:hypothetical protein
MPHIHLPEHLPGIRSAMSSRPEAAKPGDKSMYAALGGSSPNTAIGRLSYATQSLLRSLPARPRCKGSRRTAVRY